MKELELRALIRESHQQPLHICVDDGRGYTVSHPDFALVANGTLVLASGPGHDLRGPGFVLVPLEHISRIEVTKKRSRAAA